MDNRSVLILIAIGVLVAFLFLFSDNENLSESLYTTEENEPAKTCIPANGQWSVPGGGLQGRSVLNSPCCQPPDYQILDPTYATCDNPNSNDPGVTGCLETCCKVVDNQAKNFDSSWYQMAKCGCSLYCNNQNVTHFNKYGTAVRYIFGEKAIAHTGDDADFIGSLSPSGGVEPPELI